MTIAIKTNNKKLKVCPTGNNLYILFLRWYIPYVDKLYNIAIFVFITDLIFFALSVLVSKYFVVLFLIPVFLYNNIYIKYLFKKGCYVSSDTDFTILKSNHFFGNKDISYEDYRKDYKEKFEEKKFGAPKLDLYTYNEINPFFRRKEKIQEMEILYSTLYKKNKINEEAAEKVEGLTLLNVLCEIKTEKEKYEKYLQKQMDKLFELREECSNLGIRISLKKEENEEKSHEFKVINTLKYKEEKNNEQSNN